MIKRADKKDAARCIELLNLAMDEIAFKLSGTDKRDESDEILRSFFVSEINRLSYNNIYVYRFDGKIVGVMCVYDGAKIEILDEPILSHLNSIGICDELDSECFDDEFYIDSIAVDESYRGRGIAKELIAYASVLAKQKGIKKVSLIVDIDKPKAKRLYESLGFSKDTEMIVCKHRYEHMIKEIL
ncbi:GNAT family N-acetyltransferase [Campylobacter sp. faydin G-105]|uniref:GNAT family N-acetyltransferase n=1 Tax=Campylobacter anatolicus TaxID=2829105 RepID=UPI001BA2DCC0|nr:GNAT family N-acetyltransferase [Campylobacter anatolicus]MBR8462495.1 GNAT family N-acetyltransferase [Campylobacter anatolicus]